jgi:hypothetical protein
MPEDCNCGIIQTAFYDIAIALITGIAASLLTTVLLKRFEKQKAKRILLDNFRFMENINESHMFARYFLMSAKPILRYYGGIEWFHFPGKVEAKRKKSFWEDEKCKKDILGFLERNKHDVETIISVITSEKNDVLYETINKSLGISFDKSLCNISDNLKNRSHNFIDDDLKLDIDKLLEDKNLSLIYDRLFDIFAYISYLFDLYAFLGVESKLNHDFDINLELMKKKYPKQQ